MFRLVRCPEIFGLFSTGRLRACAALRRSSLDDVSEHVPLIQDEHDVFDSPLTLSQSLCVAAAV